MAGGANYVLDKGYIVADDYNSSAAAGVEAFRCVAQDSASGEIDLNATDTVRNLGVVQEKLDRTKVATGNAVADVRLLGITKVKVADTPGTIVLGSVVTAGGTAANSGGVKVAAAADIPLGVVVGPSPIGTPAAGDLIDVLLTPGVPAV